MKSPMLITSQFGKLKALHPDALLLFRRGDFYCALEEDAVKLSHLLGITLTKYSSDGHREAMFPHHCLDVYLPKIVRAGNRVAICDAV